MNKSIKFFTLGLIAILAFIPRSSFAGGSAGGGGYTIRCDNGHLYSWDYEATKEMGMPVDSKIRQITGANATKKILRLIAHRLQYKLPDMAASLFDFAKLNRNPFSADKRLWIPGTALGFIPDESTVRQIPKSCVKNSKDIRAFQTTIRFSGTRIRYEYDPAISNELARNPVQSSFFYLHEWLRDYTNDPNIIQNVDRLLHSSLIVNATSKQLIRALEDYGLKRNQIGRTYKEYISEHIYNSKEAKFEHALKAVDVNYKQCITSAEQTIRPGHCADKFNALLMKMSCTSDAESEIHHLWGMTGAFDGDHELTLESEAMMYSEDQTNYNDQALQLTNSATCK